KSNTAGGVEAKGRRVAVRRGSERRGEGCACPTWATEGGATTPVPVGGCRPWGLGRLGEVGVWVVQRQGSLGIRDGEGQGESREVEVVRAGQQDQPAGERREGPGADTTLGHGRECPWITTVSTT